MLDSIPEEQKHNCILTGLEGNECKTPGHCDESQLSRLAQEFEEEQRSEDKARIVKWLTWHPKGVTVSRTAKALFPSNDAETISERTYDSKDYRLVSRFFKNSKYAELDSNNGQKSASPSVAAFHLMQESKFPTGHNPDFAKDRARNAAYGFPNLNDVNDAQLLTRNFVTYLQSIHDKRLMLQEKDQGELKLTMPYHTRFNNDHRKKEQWARYSQAWESADSYDRGVMITRTTETKRFSSIGEMTDSLMESWQSLLETLNSKFADDDRLDYLRVLEFGGSDKSNTVGLPHLHVCVFGVPYIDHSWLSNYWASKHAQIVHVHGMHKRGSDSWIFKDDEKGQSVAGYLGKYLSKTFESIAADPDDLIDEYQSWDNDSNDEWRNAELWKLALYWSLNRQFWDCSHDLKQSDDLQQLEDIPGLGETKLERLADNDIHTLSDIRLTSKEDLTSIQGISDSFADKIIELVGSPSVFDIHNFEFVGAADYQTMPSGWSLDAKHVGVQTVT